MKLGGLFSGVGGFELAWTQLGHEVAWMCEIDKSARKVLEQRFPGVPIYEDVEQLDAAEVEAVDVLTGGSPCQGFSVAGTRSGLEHGESRLFADYIRIMDGLAERGLRWALWENVPGVLSIQNDDGERTFEHVVTALVGGTVPVRLGQGRWNTGLADGGGRAVAWRVLDSRYFGVAQRRRRVFACVAFGGVAADRAGRALLAKPEGVSGDSAACGPEGEGVAGGVADGLGSESGVAHTLTGEGFDASEDGTGRGTPIVPQAFNWQSGGDARGLDLTHEPSALTTQQTPAVLYNYGVRRLTPIECERLQAFPDGWTEPAGSDSARYKALGNAVTVNTVRWVLGRMLEQS
jgi:DNA (cytosine-5)-methyltransferase 1